MKRTPAENKLMLDSVLPNFVPVAEMRSGPDLSNVEDKRLIDALSERWRCEERQKRYKFIDEAGNIWSMRNPAIREIQTKNGYSTVIHYKPRLEFKAADAKNEYLKGGSSKFGGDF